MNSSDAPELYKQAMKHPAVRTMMNVFTSQEPRHAVILGHAFIESMVDEIIAKRCKLGKQINKDRRLYSYSTKIVILYESNLIDEQSYKLMDSLRKLRNEAAHQWDFPTKKAEQTVDAIGIEGKSAPKKFRILVAIVVGRLWEKFNEELNQAFFTPGVENLSLGSYE